MKETRHDIDDGDADAAYFRSLADGRRRVESRRAAAYEIRSTPGDDIHAGGAAAATAAPVSTESAAPVKVSGTGVSGGAESSAAADASADAAKTSRTVTIAKDASDEPPAAFRERRSPIPAPSPSVEYRTPVSAVSAPVSAPGTPLSASAVGLTKSTEGARPPASTRGDDASPAARPVAATPVASGDRSSPISGPAPSPITPLPALGPVVASGAAPVAVAGSWPAPPAGRPMALPAEPQLTPHVPRYEVELPAMPRPIVDQRTEWIPTVGHAPSTVPPPPEQPGQIEVLNCPECGLAATIDIAKRKSDDFCRACDFPLFWARSTVVAPSGAETGASLRRLPGTVGRAATAGVPCPHCAEPNSLSALICVRCGGDMHPVAAPPPIVMAPPPPAPMPEPEPVDRTWLWVLLLCLSLLAITIIVAWVMLS